MKLIEFCGYAINPQWIKYILMTKEKKEQVSYHLGGWDVWVYIVTVELAEGKKIECSYDSKEKCDKEYNRLLSELREV